MVVEELVENPVPEPPVFGPGDDELFAQIVLAQTSWSCPGHLDAGQDRRVTTLAHLKFAGSSGRPAAEMEQDVNDPQSVMGRLNREPATRCVPWARRCSIGTTSADQESLLPRSRSSEPSS